MMASDLFYSYIMPIFCVSITILVYLVHVLFIPGYNYIEGWFYSHENVALQLYQDSGSSTNPRLSHKNSANNIPTFIPGLPPQTQIMNNVSSTSDGISTPIQNGTISTIAMDKTPTNNEANITTPVIQNAPVTPGLPCITDDIAVVLGNTPSTVPVPIDIKVVMCVNILYVFI